MKIKELAEKYDLSKDDFWELKRGSLTKWIITHDAVEKIANKESIIFQVPTLLRNEKDSVAFIGTAILKDNDSDIEDGIGDAVVVLTNVAELQGTTIEDCIERAYNEIKDRTGHMNNGTFKKD